MTFTLNFLFISSKKQEGRRQQKRQISQAGVDKELLTIELRGKKTIKSYRTVIFNFFGSSFSRKQLCQPPLGSACGSLCPELKAMQPDRSRQQVPEMPEREEMTSTSSTELQLVSPQREEDRQQEDRPFLFQLNLFYCQKVNIQFDSNKTLNLHLITSNVNSPALLNYILTTRDPQTAFDLTIYSLFLPSVKRTLNIKKSVCFGRFSQPETLGLHLILSFSYHLHSMMSTIASTEDLPTALPNYRPLDFSAVNLRQISQNNLGLKDSFEKLINKHPFSLSREEDRQQEDRPFLFRSNLFHFQKVNNQFNSNKTPKLHLISISYLLHSMMSTTANIEDLLAALSNYSPFDFSAVNLRQISQNKLRKRDKIQFLKRVIQFSKILENELNIDAEKHRGKEKQYAFAVVLLKDRKCKTFAKVFPDHRHNNSKVTKHSEEILIGQIDEYLQKNGTHVQSILIYTVNSPCLKREKHTDPCMSKLVEAAHQWQSKYGFFTDVAFTNYWGLSGPNFFKDLTYSDISSPSSDFYPYIETCKTIPFKLDRKDFRPNVKKSGIYNTIRDVEDRDRNKLDNDIKSALRDLMKLAESSFGLRKEHLERGEEKISSFTFHPLVQDKISELLTKNWNEMVTNSSMSPIREKITTDFNTAVVIFFKSTLGNSSPLRLHHVSLVQRMN